MGLNLNDYEYALPNTITGSVPYRSGAWSSNEYFRAEALIIPYGRTYKIEMIRVTNGEGGWTNNLYCGISRSLNANVWQTGSGYNNNSFYVQYPEIQQTPTNSNPNADKQVVMNNQSYPMGFRHDQNSSTSYAGRTQYLLYSTVSSSNDGDGSWLSNSGFRVLSKDDGPVWLNSGDAIHIWQGGSNASSSNGAYGQNLESNYVISYIEYF